LGGDRQFYDFGFHMEAGVMLDHSVVVKNSMVVDGCGNPWFKNDVGVKDGKIVNIDRVKENAANVIDARAVWPLRVVFFAPSLTSILRANIKKVINENPDKHTDIHARFWKDVKQDRDEAKRPL
jgi:urease alpha subunit